ncbi:hypothetical protein CRUP_025568 [Coryphaenoides rupestris]|nr:hypothetical protein CRUP_025568 [Coryphaenoides rupestris]
MTEQRTKWVCDYCTYENWPSAIKCTMCHAQRPSDSSARPRVRPSSTTETTNKWSCQVCTYLNWPRAIRCTQCLTQRRRAPSPAETPQTLEPQNAGCHSIISQPVPTVDPCEEYNDRNRRHSRQSRWTCVTCTYQNWPKTLKCLACYQPRPSSLDAIRRCEPDETPPAIINEQDETRWRLGGVSSTRGSPGQRRPPPSPQWEADFTMDFQRIELAAGGGGGGSVSGKEEREASGGDIARQLTAEEVHLLNRSSAFGAGFTLVHLAIRFQRQDMLAVLLTEIRREIASSLHQRKGDFPCYFLSDLVTFTLPADIEDLPPAVQEKLFDEVLDRDLGTRLDSRLYALWNRSAGDCLLDSVLQATWGIYDKDSVLRKTLHDCLHDCSHCFGLHFSLQEEQWQEDWAFILSLASQPGASLEQTHIFVLAHILRRPIIVYGVKYYKSFRGETLGYTRFQGVYLPLLWERSFCWRSPIALGYTRGHFSALVAAENDGYDNRGAGANLDTDDDVTVTFLPLVDSDRKLLHVHFLSAQEMGNEEQQERLLRDWLDCCVTDGGLLAALQRSSRRRGPPLVAQMLERWLDRYRQVHPRPALSDGEEDEDDDE